jgi:hypothetical protein
MMFIFTLLSSLILNVYSKYYFLFELIKKSKYIKLNHFAFIIFFAVWSLLCSVRSGLFLFSDFSRLPFYMLFGLIVSSFLRRERVDVHKVLLLLLLLFYLSIAIFEIFDYDFFKLTRYFEFSQDSQILELDDETNRFAIGNPTSFSLTLLLLSFFVFIKGDKYFFLTAVLILTFYLAGSRSILVGFLIFLFFRFKFYRYFFLLVSLPLFEFVRNLNLEDRVFTLGNTGDLMRLSFYETFYNSLYECIFIGNGAGSFMIQIYNDIGRLMTPESFYIDVVFSYGLILTLSVILYHFITTGTNNIAFNFTLLLLGFLIPLHNYFLFWVFVFTLYDVKNVNPQQNV